MSTALLPRSGSTARAQRPLFSYTAFEVEGEVLTIRRRLPSHRLDELLAGVTDDNLHDETDWGEPEGREAW